MKICKRGLNFIQVCDGEGELRTCSWMRNGSIGSLLEHSIEELYHGERAENLRRPLIEGTYENCNIDNCPYLANGTIEEELVEIDEIPQYPSELWLAYEGICNYHCTCCTSHKHMEMTKNKDYSENYDRIEAALSELLPHVKTISAHGTGELFASRRILKLLAGWKPLSPPEEVSVILESNGSLFDASHWKQIENLGKYHLEVAITVMSFEERAFQYLSGTRLSISRIEDNLRFIKSLREQGIINYLELATVMQERNFREMPEFARRCIEEFGADCVRLRPIMPSGGAQDENIEWFADVRNPQHPYHQEYLEIMKDPIFQNPKVLLWSGDYVSKRGEHPGIRYRRLFQYDNKILRMVEGILQQEDFVKTLKFYMKKQELESLSIYGIGKVGKLILQLIKGEVEVKELYDNVQNGRTYLGMPIKKPCEGDFKEKSVLLLITAAEGTVEIQKELEAYGFMGEAIGVEALLWEELSSL